MSYKPRSLFRLLDDINSAIFLPHIQRPFVWDEDQMVRLFDSLMRNYPIQTFLFWRTKDEIKARKFMQRVDWNANLHDLYEPAVSESGVEKVFVLDGQQRLQTLYAIFRGGIAGIDGADAQYAYYDVTSGAPDEDEEIHHPIVFAHTPMELPYYRLADLLTRDAQRNNEEIADDINEFLDQTMEETPDECRTRQRQVRRNIAQLVSLLREDKHFWIQELDGVANDFPYARVLEIFVRVNSGGTKLSAADLMFAAMKEGWADVEEKIEEIVDILNSDSRLSFDKNLVLKCIVTATGNGAELSPDKFGGRSGERLLGTIERNWTTIEDTFAQLRDFIVHELMLFGDKVVRSYNSFIPLFDYLYHNPRPDEGIRNLMRGYYYKSQLFNWYSARTDNVVNAMHTIVGKAMPGVFPMDDIKNYFTSSGRANTVLTEADLDMRLRYILLNLIYVYKHGNSPFNVRYKGNEPHIDHIYPQSSLRSRLNLTTDEINDLGNYRFVGANDNIRKRAELPDSYFGRLRDNGVEIEKHLLLPDFSRHPSGLSFDVATYRRFRDARRRAIFEIANRVVNPELL